MKPIEISSQEIDGWTYRVTETGEVQSGGIDDDGDGQWKWTTILDTKSTSAKNWPIWAVKTALELLKKWQSLRAPKVALPNPWAWAQHEGEWYAKHPDQGSATLGYGPDRQHENIMQLVLDGRREFRARAAAHELASREREQSLEAKGRLSTVAAIAEALPSDEHDEQLIDAEIARLREPAQLELIDSEYCSVCHNRAAGIHALGFRYASHPAEQIPRTKIRKTEPAEPSEENREWTCPAHCGHSIAQHETEITCKACEQTCCEYGKRDDRI